MLQETSNVSHNYTTRLPSNLRQTTRECVYFRSRDKDGCAHHSIRHSRIPHALHANFTTLSSIEPELLPIEVLHCGNTKFRACYCCNLHIGPMTFIFELGRVPTDHKWTFYVDAFESYTCIHTDRQLDRQTYWQMPPKPLPHSFAGSKNTNNSSIKLRMSWYTFAWLGW